MQSLILKHQKMLVQTVCTAAYSAEAASAERWHRRQNKDPYVRLAREHCYRARSAFKLIEMDNKFKLLHAGSTVVELGAAPGAWTQVLVEKTNALGQMTNRPQGFVLAVDQSPVVPLPGAHLLSQANVITSKTQQLIKRMLEDRVVDLVVSDMAPNASGHQSTDQERIGRLCRLALHLAVSGDVVSLRPGGHLVCKLWDGPDRRVLVEEFKRHFSTVSTCKPPASRDDSSELFLVAKGFRPLSSK